MPIQVPLVATEYFNNDGGNSWRQQVAGSWQGGFQADVALANSGSVTVRNAAYNGRIDTGSSTSFGFTAGGAAAPATNVSCTST